jgi:hypothetical protein
MSGIRGEPVRVWLRDGTPARFVWRGRRYTVMFVLDRQLSAGSECWQVEATPERALPPATYELCHELAPDRWSLSRG